MSNINGYILRACTEFRIIMDSVLTVFIIFKLTGVIDWSWAYVLMPFWIPIVVAIPIILWLITKKKREKYDDN